MSLVSTLATAAAPALSELLYKLVTGQVKTVDDLGQGLATAAVAAGISSTRMAEMVTAEGARLTELAVAAAAKEYDE